MGESACWYGREKNVCLRTPFVLQRCLAQIGSLLLCSFSAKPRVTYARRLLALSLACQPAGGVMKPQAFCEARCSCS